MPQTDSAKSGATTANNERSLDELILELDADFEHLPEAAILEARRRRDEVIPRLIGCLREQLQVIRDGGTEYDIGNASFFSLYLLTEFRACEAFPVLVECLSLPGEGPEALFGEGVTEIAELTLARLTDDSFADIDRLMSDLSVNTMVRSAAMESLLYLVNDGRMTRDDAVHRLHGHLREALDVDRTAEYDRELDKQVMWLVNVLYEYAAPETAPEIEQAFARQLADPSLSGDLDEFRRTWEDPQTHFRKILEHAASQATFDAISRLTHFAPTAPNAAEIDPDSASDFHDDFDFTPAANSIRNEAGKVGRNDPCPCGSGKKFKKCCANS